MKIIEKGFYLTCFTILMTLLACEYNIETSKQEVPNVYVLNSLITPDSVFSCYVHKVTSPLAKQFTFVENATVRIIDTETTTELCSLQYIDSGYYSSPNIKPIEGKQYTIIVETKDGNLLSGTTKVPFKVIADTSYLSPATRDQYFVKTCNGFLSLTDKVGVEFYEIEILSMQQYNSNTYYSNNIFLSSRDSILNQNNSFLVEKKNLQFTDEMFQNTQHTFKFEYKQNGFDETFKLTTTTVVRCISAEYYYYVKSWPKHYEEQSIKELNLLQPTGGILGFMNTPVPLYSNISGGVGIFAAYVSSFKLGYEVTK